MARYDVFAFVIGYAACLFGGLFVPGPPSWELLLTALVNMWGIIICTLWVGYQDWREISKTST